MKSLKFRSLILVSHKEKRAREVKFHPEVTVIKGANDVGKSSLIKSILNTLGASPHNIHRDWKAADCASLLSFSIGSKEYSAYRHRDSFSLFDGDNELIGTYTSVTNGLGPQFANLVGFDLRLLNRANEAIIPPPAYFFLPYYIDQDKGWIKPWNSFKNLQQFPKWQQRVPDYHLGMRPNEWYKLDADIKNLEVTLEEPRLEAKSLDKMILKTRESLSRVDFDIDIDVFKKEIEQLLDQCKILKQAEDNYRTRLMDLRTEKIRLDAQVEIVKKTYDELSKDYKFASSIINDHVGCPTCGAEYENSFLERFDIAKDTETCSEMLVSIQQDLRKIESTISRVESELNNAIASQDRIKDLLSTKQGEVKLHDIVEAEGKKTLFRHLNTEMKECQQRIGELLAELGRKNERLREIDSPKKRKIIRRYYAEQLRKYASTLQVNKLEESVYKKILPTINESGSDLPRAILAHFFSAISTIREYGTTTVCPIIIDAPNQQEQDPDNLEHIMRFISENRPPGAQLIIGLVDQANIDMSGDVIELDEKLSVLQEDKYEDLSQAIKEFELRNLGAN